MNHHIITLLNIDPETISMVFNIGFFVLIGLIAIGFLIGLWRGVWKSGFHLIIVGGLVIVVFLASRPLSEALADVNINALLGNFGISIPVVNLTLGESLITLNITSIRETVQSFVTQLFNALGMTTGGSSSDTAALILAFTLVLIRYVVFILLGILISTIGELLASLLYFFPFRLFIPKPLRKKHKLRLVGGLLNAVKVALVTVMIMVPFSSVLNTINQALHNDDNAVAQGIDDPTYVQMMSFIDAYNDSLFAQLMFNWSVDDQGRTLDTVLMDYVTGEQVDDYMLTLSGELFTVASIGQTILSTGIINQGLNDTTASILLAEDIVSSLILNITGSALIMEALPIAVSVAMNMEQVQEFVDPNLLDLEGINWEDDLTNVKDIAVDVINSGVIDSFMNPDTTTADKIVTMVSDEAYPEVRSALHRIDDSEFLSQVLPAVVFKLVNDEVSSPDPVEGIGLATFFPTEWDDYADLHFGEEIALVYDVIHNIANLDPDLLPALFDITNLGEETNPFADPFDDSTFSGGRIKSLSQKIKTPQGLTPEEQTLIDIIRANSDELIEIIVGELDVDGLPIGVDPDTSKTILFDIDGLPLPDVSANLLDSGLLIHGLDDLLDMAMTPLLETLAGGASFDRTSLEDVLTLLNGNDNGEKRYNYKGEFGAVLGIISAIFQNDSLVTLIFPEEEPPSNPLARGPKLSSVPTSEDPADTGLLTLFEDSEFRDGFKEDVCPLLDRSRIMGAVLPDVLEGALSAPEMDDLLSPLGLTVADLNFDFGDVGTQMSYLIDIVGFSLSVVDQLDTIFEDVAPVADDLIGLLDSLYMSDIINPKDDDGLMIGENYYNMLTELFNSAGNLDFDEDEFDTAMRSVPSDGWTTTYDEFGDPIVTGENYSLIKFVETAMVVVGDIDTEGDVLDQMISYASDPDDPIGTMFDSIDSSIIISATMGGMLDNLIGPTGGLVDPTIGSSFGNVQDWHEEGANLKIILNSLNDFTEGLDNIDFLNSDPVKVESLLKSLARSQIFNAPSDEYVFSDFLLAKLKGTGTLMADYIYDPYEDGTSLSPYDRVTADFHAVGQTPATAINWHGDGGEIDKIVAFVTAIQTFADGDPDPINKLQNDPTISSVDVKPIMLALNDIGSMRIMLYNMFDLILGTDQFNVGSLVLAEHNSYILLTMDESSDRELEIDYAFEVYASLETLALNGGAAFSMDTLTTENIAEIETMLNALHHSKIFNMFDESFESRSHALGNLTIFEQVVEMIFDTSMMDTYIYAELADPLDVDAALRDDIMAIPNNFTDTDNPLDEWIGPSGEIKAITNVLTSFKNTGLSFDDFGNDGAASFSTLLSEAGGTTKVETLLLDINLSRIAYPSIPNLFDEIFTSGSFAIDGVDLNDANTDFFRDEPLASERATEITQLMDVYEGINDLGLTDGTPLTLASIDGVGIETLMNDMHDSKVFNTFITGNDHATDDLTIFEQTIKMLYTVTNFVDHIYSDELEGDRPGLLVDDIIDIGNNFAATVPANPDNWIGVNGEIATIKNILVALKDTDIDFDSMDNPAALTTEFDLLLGVPTGQAKVEVLMARINESYIAWPANPNLLDQMFSADGFSITGVTIADSNPSYLKTMGVVSERQEELDKVFDIYELVDSLGVNDGTPFDETQIDPLIIDDLLNALHDSLIFNTLQPTKDRLLLDITVFEQMVWMIIDQSQLDAYIYEGIGSDPALKEDIIAIGNDFAGHEPLNDDGWVDVALPATTGEITRIVDILDAFSASGLSFATFSGAGSSDVLSTLLDDDATAVENMLLAMNHSSIVYPSIPNLFANMLTSGDVAIAGVDFTDANTHYRGNRGDPLIDDQYLPYQDGEITQLLGIYSDAKVVATKTYTDLTLIANSDIDSIQALAESLFASNVFHQEGVPGGLPTDATVFEQLMIKMMNDTGLSTLINDSLNPNPNYYVAMVYKFASAAEKAEYLVVNYETLFGMSAEHHTNDWEGDSGEINALFRVFKEVKRVMPTSTGTSGIDPTTLSPTEISSILAVLNYSNLASDAVADLLRDAFQSISFDVYTEGKEDYYLSPVDYFTTDLTTMDYSTTDFTALNPPVVGPQGVIEELLSEFYDGAAYEDMGATFDIGAFIGGGHTTEPLLHLFDVSQVFTNDVSGETYKTRSLAFHNILDSASIAKYIDFNNPLTDKDSKSNKIEAIFLNSFDYEFEAERLDLYVETLIDFNGVTDGSSIEGYGSEFRSLIELTYVLDGSQNISDRAYLVSEMSAGFYTDIFEEEYAKVVPTPTIIDFYGTDYANLNPVEADGVEGALSVIDEIDLIVGGIFDETDVARLQGHFVKMGSLLHTDVTGGPFGTASYDYTNYDSSGNSLIAKLFYAAEVVQSPNFGTFATALTAYALTYKSAIVNLDSNPYNTNFVFEVEGDKIYFVYA
ncbi:MAG TPA: hypothetical protein DCM23_01555 [Firmicutes bacterium]|nr:hypothetical protein [Bacillota bacterium]